MLSGSRLLLRVSTSTADHVGLCADAKDSAGGYHGYWANDLYAVNSNYGTAADLKSLVSSAHAKVCISQALLVT
jgi:1,4-alpha-glucan branching enzyme